MDLNGKIILKVTGNLMAVVGFSMVPAVVVALIYGEERSLHAFGGTALFTILAGLLLANRAKPSDTRLKIRDGFLIVAVSWGLISVLGAVPFMLSGEIPNFIDAFFETASGLSTTGASILTDIEALSKSTLFWRCFIQWLGGMGILVFAIALLPALGIGGTFIAKAEAPGPTLEKLTPKMSDTAKLLYILYLGFTILQVVLLLLGGMSFYDALVHSFSTISTGGFSSYNTSIAHFDSAYIDTVITVFMILGGVSFNLYFAALRHGVRSFLHDAEFKLYLLIILASALLITINLYASQIYDNIGSAFRYSMFQASSIITTTGHVTADYDLWPTFSKMIIFALMFVGGCSSSTGGGIKVIRILMLFKLIGRGIFIRLHPNAVVSIKLGERTMPSDVISRITSFMFLYLAVFFLGSLLISLDNVDMMSGISAVASCLGNIGPGFGIVGPVRNYDSFSYFSKAVLSFLMLAGRLELFTLLMLFAPRFWNPNR